MRRDPRRGGATLIEFREPARVDRSGAEHERLEHDELHVWQRAARVVEQRRVLLLVVLHRARVAVRERVPEVVHADQDAHDVWLQIERVRRPALLQVGHLVAADAAIVELELARRTLG